ncbi:hypothetical protein COY93_00765 [Candidatus Uhrbacteria bacterium CG_4_10_14_0_8_um_filter_58_22]|uniref:DUF192 domain-containing protein n=1 Tax=Candidatus Uhrbacteria bacterium CG_4_10_14_0_8_um_filter_58_22 TaxID=1975029 RepID=A0A2M7QAX2_9BACT|nr:MAG: hypothetical protein COY93_00765 [Candidatus Uhrbacteria bacterium CG_4_10_14_0_8_um_filter_58_22]
MTTRHSDDSYRPILSSIRTVGWRGTIAVATLAVLAVATLLLRWQQHGFGHGQVILNGVVTVNVEVAASDSTRQRGLSGRAGLPEDAGVLFLFSEPKKYAFWMKDMRFPIEAIWIRDGQVVDLSYGLLPPSEGEPPQVFTPLESAGAVLEVPAGFIERHDIRLGQSATADVDRLGGLR